MSVAVRLLLATALAVAVAACGQERMEATADTEGRDEARQFDPSLDHLERGLVVLEREADGEHVEVAVTLPRSDAEFRRGLMDVADLADGTGMLFDFGRDRTGGFWMKDTFVPLDIAFAADDGRIVEILSMEPCPAEPCPTYDPGVAYRYALEVPRGWFAANDVGPGDRLEPPP